MKSLDINPRDYVAHLKPGKFEGEPNGATEYFWEQYLNGDGEAIYQPVKDDILEGDPVGTLFLINADEAEAFNLPIGHTFLLREDSQGFCYGETYPTHSFAVRAFTNEQ